MCVANKYVRTENQFKFKISGTIKANNEHTMFGNDVRPILSPTAKKLQFLCIINERLGFTVVHNLYLYTTILITTSSQNRTPCRHPTTILWACYVALALLDWPCPLIMLSLTMIHTQQTLKKSLFRLLISWSFPSLKLDFFSLSSSSEIFLLFFDTLELTHANELLLLFEHIRTFKLCR